MNVQSVKAWLQQPTTIMGISGLVGTLSGIAAHALTHDTTVTTAVGLGAASIMHVVMPDNSAAPSAVEKLAVDAITAVAQKKLAASIPMLFADAMAVVQDVQPPSGPPAPPPAA